MRDIKFRGKGLYDHTWHYGSLIVKRTGETSIYFEYDNGKILTHIVDPETVGQYAARKDKYNVEIYEGDIIKRQPDIVPQIFVYDTILNPLLMIGITHSEVIGNIYQNPDLIKEGV